MTLPYFIIQYMPVFLGLDCGGSSCRALALNERAEIIHMGQAGPANLASTPPKRLEANVAKALENCPSPDFVAGCFAGLLTEEDRSRAEALLRTITPNAVLRAEPDYVAAFLACDPEPDLCIIAGTGSLVCSRVKDRIVKSGGGGYLVGDFGSACRYGQAALQHFLAVGPGGCSDQLVHAVEKQFESREENEVLARLYRGGAPASRLAKLAPALAKDAQAGEAYALEAIRDQSRLLAQIIARHLQRFHPGWEEISATLAGGLWDASSLFQSQLEAALRADLPNCAFHLARITRPPVQGAVRLAQELQR